MKFYVVVCERGHCGCGRSSEIKFAIAAENMIHACNIARKMPSVKHTKMMLFAKEITEQEYNEYRQVSAYERFSQHKSKRRR